MLEIVVLICAIAAAFYTPIEAKKVHDGWVRPKFKGTPEEFRAKYIKQLKAFTWIGFGLGALYAVLGALIADNSAELIIKLVIGAVWIVVGAINLTMRRKYFESAAGA
ncbi:MAG: hypothetical protein K0S54_2980 [Alphaproteobacteria bacterium]|jgi:hypothetical protein|nr:hypothetical protein [Alphaproteobacteria bacterium]